jgi:hypothetical protein
MYSDLQNITVGAFFGAHKIPMYKVYEFQKSKTRGVTRDLNRTRVRRRQPPAVQTTGVGDPA